ncbi:MAG: hypothetical protein EA350_06675 [Gemmatimonadales bacterium]|nr:MAG: hypothetical protein EA350_06675 [Gemmatimonadales bacterium]
MASHDESSASRGRHRGPERGRAPGSTPQTPCPLPDRTRFLLLINDSRGGRKFQRKARFPLMQRGRSVLSQAFSRISGRCSSRYPRILQSFPMLPADFLRSIPQPPAPPLCPVPRCRGVRARVTAALVPVVVLLLPGCGTSLHLVESDHARVLAHQAIEGESPSSPGVFEVGFLTYGSGTDRNRIEYGDSVAFTTTAVDASKLVSLGGEAASRKRFWGFGPDEFPRNGRVWYPVRPEGAADGPFPLVLIVHGNHNPREFSDPGYAYLGELLASRGFILVSVDMNFLNGAIRGENDARGWMLLQHLKAWQGFDADEDNPFHGTVDWERIALMGHSRGGEAVAHAAAFNRLTHYPDDASLTFDFGFDIRSLVAIAPVDGQYEPSNRAVPLEDVNYLVFHGSHDGDVTSFAGLRQYARVGFSGRVPAFKSAVYVYRANHGQWNEEWGAFDNGPRSPRILALDGLMPMEDQLEFARVYIAAFLEATLREDPRFLPLFRDHRTAGGWLPPTMYKTRFQHASFRPLADFSEDIDLTTGTVPGVTLQGVGLSTWREGEMVLRSRITPQRQVSQQRQGVWLGWHRTAEAEPAAAEKAASAGDPDASDAACEVATTDDLGCDPMGPPRYSIALPEGLAAEWGAGTGTTLELEVAPTERKPPPPPPPTPEPTQADGPDDAANDPSANRAGVQEQDANPPTAPSTDPDDEDDPEESEPMDFSLELVDASGARATLPISQFGPLRAPLDIRVLRRSDLENSRFPTLHEVVGHGFSVPLDEFTSVNPELDLSTLREIHLVFDRTRVGEIIVSGVGLAQPGDAFLAPRVNGGTGAPSETDAAPPGSNLGCRPGNPEAPCVELGRVPGPT